MRQRRALVFATAAGLGAAAGAGAWWWRGSEADSELSRLWAQSFATPSGAALAMGTLAGKPLLLNFWATWCPPCVAEIPLLDQFATAHGGRWNVVAMALDNPDAVRQFLAKVPATNLSVVLANGDGLDLARNFGGHGALPYSVAFDSAGHRAAAHEGALDAIRLQNWASETR